MLESVSRTKLLDYLKFQDYIKIGNIQTDWDSIIQECEETVKKYPEYWASLLPDKPDSWDNLGDQYYSSMNCFRDWGYTKNNTQSWETTAKQPQIHMKWEKTILDWLPLDHAISRPTLQRPGNVMPWHEDKFFYFKRKFPDQTNNVVRFLVFMKDWETGHLIQAGNSFISHWKAGDVILWYPSRMHIGANVGFTNKWTQNVTGILKKNICIKNTKLDLDENYER